MADCRENCDNNCAALDGLYEKAVNLIAYSNLINSWVNGPQNGTVNVAGTNVPTLLNLATSLKSQSDTLIANLQNRINNIPNSIIQNGGGISIDSNGELFINFDAMPTDKFEVLLKSLRLPIWLAANKTFYVNVTTGSDTLDDKRGESASKPFKNPQACVNYVANNYNIGNFIASIKLADGTYTGGITLPDYSRNNGHIVIESQSGNPANCKIVQNSASGSVINCTGGVWYVQNLSLELRPDLGDVLANNVPYVSLALASGKNSDLSLFGNNYKFAPTGGVPASTYVLDCLRATEGGTLRLRPGNTVHSLITDTYPSSGMNVRILTANANGSIQFGGWPTTDMKPGLQLNAIYNTCAYADNGNISISSSYAYPPFVSNSAAANGKRYTCMSGGSIKTQTGAADFLPGSIAGTVETASYSWYA